MAGRQKEAAVRATQVDNAKEQAIAQMASIKTMVEALDRANGTTDYGAQDEAVNAIQEDALSVEVRDDWRTVGDDSGSAVEFRILLCTGGPAVRLFGELAKDGEPKNAEIQYQGWGTPWTRLIDDSGEKCTKYHGKEWAKLVQTGWITAYVDNDGIAFMLKAEPSEGGK